MRIGIIVGMFGAPWGGSEELWSDMAEAARADGHEVMACVFRWPIEPPRLEQLRGKGVLITKRLRPRYIPLWRRFGKLHVLRFAEMTAFKPDVLCISQGGTHDVADGPEFSRLKVLLDTGVPYVVICHASQPHFVPSQILRKRVIEYFGQARKVIFIAEENRICAERNLAQGLPGAVVIQNPVNITSIDPLPWPSHDPARPVRLACVARLDCTHKGHDVLLESLRGEPWSGREWRLRFYGTGTDQAYLSDLAQFYQIADRVEFVGQVNDVRSIWAENHMLVLGSRLEGTPLSLVEAMLCGRPAVVTDVGGNTEWIENNVTGFVAEAATAGSIRSAMERAWQARERWQTMGETAHATAAAKFDCHAGQTLLKLVLAASKSVIN